ncbi:MAG TPA: M20/M25/M40 family metallo-hydrolase [Steroidobacteraceae bacterium]|nr:M20/M25/M40 family metallo-hydrolase [Steroidobacteraceae bacterium]
MWLLVGTAVGVSASTPGNAAPARNPIDPVAISAIRSEGLQNNQVMDHLSWLADVYGPRGAGTPALLDASDWAMHQFRSWGLSGVHREYFQQGEGWSLEKANIAMIEPQVMPIIGLPLAWTPGTNGPIEAEAVAAHLRSEADFALWRGKLRGKVVLIQAMRPVGLLDQPPAHRYSDGDLAALLKTPISAQWQSPEARRPERDATVRGLTAHDTHDEAAWNDRLIAFLKAEGVVAVLDRGDDRSVVRLGPAENIAGTVQRTDGGTIFVDNALPGMNNETRLLPWLTIAVEQYNRMLRILEKGLPVKVALDVEVKWWPERSPGNGFNTLAEIPGTDLKDQVVLLGAHLDGKTNATAATDDGAGCAAMMEAVRILMHTGVRPRRTIRVGLWGGEELGLLGSSDYVKRHYSDPKTGASDAARVSVYFNVDNGTGRARGLWLQNNLAAESTLKSWIEPLSDLGVTTIARRGTTGGYTGEHLSSGTDHLSFDAVGIPAFQFIQDRLEYFNRTAHSNMDYVDHASKDDLIQLSTTVAVLAYEAAMADDPVPRKTILHAGNQRAPRDETR